MESGNSRHRCLIYDGPPSAHLPIIAAAIQEHLGTGYRCLYLNSPTMIAGIRTYLAASGVDVAQCVAKGSLLFSSEENFVDGKFDIDGTLKKLESLARGSVSEGYIGLFASGDMLWEFGSERNLDKLLQYEMRLEELLKGLPSLCGICQYHRDILPTSAIQAALYTHQTVYVNNTLTMMNPHFEKPATLQQEPNTRFY